MRSSRPHALSPLPRHLAIAYGLLIVYACLHPLTGWRMPGLPLLDYLTAPWPRYFTWLDLAFNVIGFLPFGFFLAPVLGQRMAPGWAVLLAAAAGSSLSFSMETTQNFLPSRVASNVDLGCNSLGTLLGALAGARWGPALFGRRGGLHRWRQRRVMAGRQGDLGMLLLGLWLLAQLSPATTLFATGDLRELLDLPQPLPFDPGHYLRLEAAVAASSLLAVGLLARQLMRRPGYPALLTLILLGLTTKTLAGASFFIPAEPLHWASPGALAGLGVGSLMLLLALCLPAGLRQSLAHLALLAATALANLMPVNPYLANTSLVREGNFLNFHGLTHVVGILWPFLALLELSALGRRLPEARNAPPGPPL